MTVEATAKRLCSICDDPLGASNPGGVCMLCLERREKKEICKYCDSTLRSGNKDGVCSSCKQRGASAAAPPAGVDDVVERVMALPAPGRTRKNTSLNLAAARAMTPAPDALGEKVRELRAAIFDAITVEDVTALMKGQVEKAKDGDPAALKLILNMIGNGSGGTKQQVVVVQQNAGSAEGMNGA